MFATACISVMYVCACVCVYSTWSTVGYGDFSCKTLIGKTFIVFFIMFGLVSYSLLHVLVLFYSTLSNTGSYIGFVIRTHF